MSVQSQSVFTQGSTLRHILVMSSTSAIGLLALFIVDLVDMYFLSLLGQAELAAAVGFAGTLLFFLTAMSIGLQIGVGALVARSEGGSDRLLAQRYCSSGMIYSFCLAALLSFFCWFYLQELLVFLGAKGKTLDYALVYCQILLPSSALLAIAMCAAAVLRSLGDAKHSMLATLGGGAVNALLDPIFIFSFGWGIEGAAAASVVARLAIFLIAFSYLIKKHHFLSWPKSAFILGDIKSVNRVALPAMLTNLATPLGSGYVMKAMAEFGDDAVAASAILGRVIPVAFAGLFALSGAIGPIIGQNAGAHLFVRVRATLLNAVMVNIAYCLTIWLILYFSRDWIVALFSAEAVTAELINFYCVYLAGLFIFNGLLFTSNASFNNLNKAHYATVFNFSRALLGTIPLVYWLSGEYGAFGVLAGELLGSVVFGCLAFATVLWQIRGSRLAVSKGLEEFEVEVSRQVETEAILSCQNALSSQQSQLGQPCEMPSYQTVRRDDDH